MLARLLGLRIYDIEASSCCNVDCAFCPREHLPEKGLMRAKTFAAFLGQVPLRSVDTLMFVGIGEPLLNPRLPDFIAAAKQRHPGVYTMVCTNGTLLGPRTVPALLDAGLDILDVSFNGLDPEAYERLVRGARFADTLERVEYAAAEVRHRTGPTRLQVNYIQTRENIARKGEIEAFWRRRGVDRFRAQKMHTRNGAVGVTGMSSPDHSGLRRRYCRKFMFMPFVTWTGEVLYCSHDFRRAHPIGNVRDDSWAQIEARRQKILSAGCWPDMCASCDDAMRHDLEAEISDGVRREAIARVFTKLKRWGARPTVRDRAGECDPGKARPGPSQRRFIESNTPGRKAEECLRATTEKQAASTSGENAR